MLAREGLCQSSRVLEEKGGSLFSKLLKVTNEVRLVVIAAVGGYGCPSFLIVVEDLENLLKTQDPAKQFRPYAYFVQESTFQLATTDAGFNGQPIHRCSSATVNNFRGNTREPRIVFAIAHPLDQQPFNGS